jgi:hypothetical protein
MLQFTQDRLTRLALTRFSEKLWELMRDRVRLPRAVSLEEVQEAVFFCEAQGRANGFASELDIGLYVIARFCFPEKARSGDLDRAMAGSSLSNDEKRYRLSAVLAEAGFMDFGGLEERPTPDQIRLWQAIENDDAEAVKAAIAAGAPAKPDGENQVDPLLLALSQGKKNGLRELLKSGANPNRKTETDADAVTVAASMACRDLEFLRIVLDHRGNPNSREVNGDPVLIRLIAQGQTDGIRLLAAKGADLNARDGKNRPAILIAAWYELWNMVWTLIELGADWKACGQALARLAHRSGIDEQNGLYPWLKKTTEFLRAQGIAFPYDQPEGGKRDIS